MTEYLKCRLCKWKTPKWTTNKKGQKRNGYPKLQNHFMMEHSDQYEDVIIKCNEIDRMSNDL